MPKIISIRGHIGFQVTAADVMKQLAEAKGKPVRAEISSHGGFVSEGIDMFNLLRDYEGETTAVIMSMAASMGSYIPLACDKVIAHDNAVFMIHNALMPVIGNHNDLRKVADRLESLSNLLAQEYIKKTGKSLAEIKEMMDAETFLFGDEIKENGFIDEIIEAPKDAKHKDDKSSAITEARLGVESVFKAMEESGRINSDIERAAAYISYHVPEMSQKPGVPTEPAAGPEAKVKTPPDGGDKKEEGKIMPTLAKLLEENPGAKTEHDDLVAKAKKLGREEGEKALQEKVEKMTTIISSGYYPASLKNLAVKAIKGESTVDAAEGAVAAFDATKEGQDLKAAFEEQAKQKETPGGGGPAGGPSEDGLISSEEDYQNEIALMKGEKPGEGGK
jgi:ATP-dependent protease ClpP protease subunit